MSSTTNQRRTERVDRIWIFSVNALTFVFVVLAGLWMSPLPMSIITIPLALLAGLTLYAFLRIYNNAIDKDLEGNWRRGDSRGGRPEQHPHHR